MTILTRRLGHRPTKDRWRRRHSTRADISACRRVKILAADNSPCFARRSSQIGDLKKSDLPGAEALHEPGKKEGDIKLVKTESGSVEAYQVRGRPGSFPSLARLQY